jgi:hypothetical protein
MSRSAEGVIERRIRLASVAERRRRCVGYLIQNALSSRSSWKPYSVTQPRPWARPWRTSLKNSNVGTASSVSGVRNMPSANVRRNDCREESEMFRRSSAAVATSREGHRSPRSGREGAGTLDVQTSCEVVFQKMQMVVQKKHGQIVLQHCYVSQTREQRTAAC